MEGQSSARSTYRREQVEVEMSEADEFRRWAGVQVERGQHVQRPCYRRELKNCPSGPSAIHKGAPSETELQAEVWQGLGGRGGDLDFT